MANKKVTVDITTTANTSGADKTVKSIEQIERAKAKQDAAAEAASAREAARQARAEAAAERAAGVAQRREEKAAKQAEIASQRKEAAAKREEAAIKRVQGAADAAAEKAAKNAARLESEASVKGSRGAAIKVQQAGYQVADFATQVTGGTSALTALGQQLPQFLGAFGPQGAVAGALIAVGLTAYKVFSGIGDSMEKAKERADFLAKAINEGAVLAAKTLTEDYDMGASSLGNAQTIAESLRQKFVDIAKAEGEFAAAALKNTQSLNAAEVRLQELMGARYDTQKMSDFHAKEQEAIRAQEHQNKVRDEQAKQAAAERAKTRTDELVALKTQAFNEQTASLAANEKELNVLLTQKNALEAIVAKRKTIAELGFMHVAALPAALEQNKASKSAEQSLKGSEYVARIPILEASIKELQSQVGEFGVVTNELKTLNVEAGAAQSELAATSKEVTLKIEGLKEAHRLEQIQAAVDKIEKDGKAKAEEITKLIADVKPETSGEKAAFEQLQTAVSDHIIQVGESTATAASLATLSGKIREATSGQSQVITELITSMQKMKQDADAQLRTISALQSRVNSIPMSIGR